MNKLEFLDVEMSNFLSYGKVPQKITFVPGVNLILGIDNERNRSNGSGKSSSIEAILFALFGRLNRNTKKDQIINWKNRKNCLVKLTFKKNNDTYTVIRGIKPDKLEVYKNNNLIPPLSDVRLYQKQFENDIIELDFNTFISIIHTNLNSLTPILKMDSAKKRSFLERVFGLEIYSKINEKSNQKIKVISDNLYKNNVDIDYDKRKYNELQGQLTDFNKKLSSIASSETELEDIKNEISKITVTEDDIDRVDNELVELNKDIETLISNKGILELSFERNDVKIEGILLKLNDVKNNIEKSNKYKKLSEEFKTLGNVIDLCAQEDAASTELKICEETMSSSIHEKNKSVGNISGYEILLGDLRNKLDTLQDKNICPTCGSELSSTNIVDKIKNQVDNLQELIKQETGRQKEYNTFIEKNIIRKEKINEEIKNINNKITKIGNIEKEMSLYEEYKDYTSDIEVLSQQVVELNDNNKNINDEITTISNKIIDKKNKVSTYTIDIANMRKNIKLLGLLQAKLLVLEEKLEQENKTKDEIKTTITTLEYDISNLLKKIRETEAKNNKLNDIIDYLEYIKTLCKDDNVKQFAISSIMPFLTKQVNYYLAEGGCNFYLKFTGWLDEEICGPGITDCSYGNLSGGETRSIDLALQLAFLDILHLQLVTAPDIIVFDEILDSSIDSSGLSSLLKIIRAKQKENNSKVFIITHRQEVTDIDVDNIYYVYKENGFSKIRGM
jgi:DNA repair exonuclease SbcCD ATPase subunit